MLTSEVNSHILMKKYRQYLLPSVLTSMALALNEFADSIIVSNLLGSDALAAISVGCPILMFIAVLYVLIGSGGATLYAYHRGRWENDKAGTYFRLSLYLSIIAGGLFLLLGVLLRDPLTPLFCPDENVRPMFDEYYLPLMISAPFLTVLLTISYFLPPSGAPVVATVISIVSNCVNLLMDFVYIKFFHMGIAGAAYATITGYSLGLLIVIVMIVSKRVVIVDKSVRLADWRRVPKIITQGSATALLQVCYAIKYGFCNHMSTLYGGTPGLLAFSLCLQTTSLAAVFLLGVADTAQPLLAMLSGQNDYKGEKRILRISLLLQLILSVLMVVFFEAAPQLIAVIYDVTEPEAVRIGMRGIRIFSIFYIARGVTIQFMRYLQVEQKKGYALFISLCDGLLILPIALLLCPLVGLDGLFVAFPAASFLLLDLIVAINLILFWRNHEKYEDVLLIRKNTRDCVVRTMTITDSDESISRASEEIIAFCRENHVERKLSMRMGLLCEEMAIYTQNHRKEAGEIDIMVRIEDSRLMLIFRSIGIPFDPIQRTADDVPENLLILQKTATKIAYDYIMGMNNTQIILTRTE